jgi:ABC-2 type transport system permease protein
MHAPWYAWLLTPLWCACGTLVYTSMLVTFGSLSFKLLGPFSFHLMVPHNLLQATRYPLTIYPRWLFYLLLTALPFGCSQFLPASFLLGKGGAFWMALVPPVAAALCMALASRAWNWGLRQYESTGS